MPDIYEIPFDLLPEESLAHSNPKIRAGIKESIKKNGLLEPLEVIIDVSRIIIAKGNQRIRCLKELKFNSAPCKIIINDRFLNEYIKKIKEGRDERKEGRKEESK